MDFIITNKNILAIIPHGNDKMRPATTSMIIIIFPNPLRTPKNKAKQILDTALISFIIGRIANIKAYP